MQLSVEVLDHIFSFLVSHRKTLISCLKDPVLSPVVERHLYYHVIIHIGRSNARLYSAFEADHFSRLVSENPRILYHVKILEVDISYFSVTDVDDRTVCRELCREFSATLLKFPVLGCIILNNHEFVWPSAFRAALADRLNLPTLKELHVESSNTFPLSLLDGCKSIENLSLSGSFMSEGPLSNPSMPQLKSLVLNTESALAGLKPQLQSFGCGPDSVKMLPEFLGVCSGTLTNLEVDLVDSQYFHKYISKTGTTVPSTLPDLPSIPHNLQQLTIRTAVDPQDNDDGEPQCCSSYLPAANKIISLFLSSPPRRLALDIYIVLETFADLTLIDFSPLAVLGTASLSIPRIDLYVCTGILPPALTRAQLLSSLEDYEHIMTSIKEGILVLHLEEVAPDCIRDSWAWPVTV